MSKGYTSVSDVAAHIGRTLTADQQALVTDMLDDAESFIDRRTGRNWASAAIVGEVYDLGQTVPRPHFYLTPSDYDMLMLGPINYVYLRTAPVASIQQVVGFYDSIPDTAVLVEDTDWRALNLASGLIALSGLMPYSRVRVDYTPAAPVPNDIHRAATQLIAHWLVPALDTASLGASEVRIAGDLMVRYDTADIPAGTLRLIDNWRRIVLA